MPYLETSFENERSTLTVPVIVEEDNEDSNAASEQVPGNEKSAEKSTESAEKSAESAEKSAEKSAESAEKSAEKMLLLMKQNPNITIRQLIELIGIKERAIINNINKLKKSGLLERIGADKGGYWKINQ
ncbi:hypothetical protein FACS1894177_03160 [Bacteroidia bacterium]|nr:hypothetical protein FACS1894177_03160 [Bacteroidia bacterium]